MKLIPFSIISYFILGLFVLGACQSTSEDGYEQTDSGLKYKFIKEGEGTKPDSGDFLLLNMTYRVGDSTLLNTSDQGGPAPVRLESTNPKTQVFEAFGMLKAGDSMEFQVTPQELFVKTFNSAIPPFADSTDMVTFDVGVEKTMTEQDFQAYQMEMMQKQQEEMLAQMSEQMATDSALIEEHLAQNNIQAQATESGLRYVITQQGKGAEPAPGDSVYVQYRGTLLDGQQFQSSYDSNEPFGFVLGQRQVIPGWDEGIALLNEGGKATFYIPSPLAYGPRRAGELIGENSILVFDVELTKVTRN